MRIEANSKNDESDIMQVVKIPVIVPSE